MILITKTSDQTRQRGCVCVCVAIPFVLGVRLVDVPAGVTQEGHTGILIHLPSAVLALTFVRVTASGFDSRPNVRRFSRLTN